MPHSAKENGVEATKLLKAIYRHHASGVEVEIAAPVEMLPLALDIQIARGRFDDAEAFGNDFMSDTVAFDDGDVVGLQEESLRVDDIVWPTKPQSLELI